MNKYDLSFPFSKIFLFTNQTISLFHFIIQGKPHESGRSKKIVNNLYLVFTIVYLDNIQFLIHSFIGVFKVFSHFFACLEPLTTQGRTTTRVRYYLRHEPASPSLAISWCLRTRPKQFKILRIPQCFYQFKFEIPRLRSV